MPDTFKSIGASDLVKVSDPFSKIWVGTGGNISLKNADGSTVILKNVPNGTMLEVDAIQVMATGTTATDIVGIY